MNDRPPSHRRGVWPLYLLRTLLYGWVHSLVQLKRLLRRDRRPKDAPNPTCVPIDHPALVRPDPLLYCQRHLIDQGLAVTWDNPDIELFRNGAPVASYDLDPLTTYEVRARIWNDSLDAPVIAMPVHLSYLDFGVGTQSVPIATGSVDVGVKGGAGQPGFVSIPWTTPPTPGHYCLQVLLDPADDKDPTNNLGQENTDVRAAQSPASFAFVLRNDTRRSQRYRFETDGYELAVREPCATAEKDQAQRLAGHRRALHPVPQGFDIAVSPASPELDPGVAVRVEVSIDPPADFLGARRFNVNAFHEQGFAGGVTLTVVKEQ